MNRALFKKYFYSKTTVLVLVAIGIIAFEQNSNWVESFFYKGIYPFISSSLRTVTNLFPFSIGDVFYILLTIYLFYKFVFFVKKLVSVSSKKYYLKNSLFKCINFILIFFIFFKLLWGLNYSRLGVAHQFKLPQANYSKEELRDLMLDVIFDANYCRKQITDTNLPTVSFDTIVKESKLCYQKISLAYPFLQSNTIQVKKSLFSGIGSYLGFCGYYNPFSGEAQLRNDLPSIIVPAIATHEMAHQLGYASEDEANFIGYLAANESNNILFRYSLDLDILDYLQVEYLKMNFEKDSISKFNNLIYAMHDCMEKQVRKDRKEVKDFFRKNRKQMASYSNFIYDKYLKLNKQESGIESYNEVIGWIINYRKQFKK